MRIKSLRAAGARYQKTLRGKQKHALRQKRYRQRQMEASEIVTHQSSPAAPDNDLLPTETQNNKKPLAPTDRGSMICHFCSKNCSKFLRRRSRNMKSTSSSWPSGP